MSQVRRYATMWVAALVACSTILLTGFSAQALTVNGTLRFWDTRFRRSNSTGSQLSQTSYQTNVNLPNAYITLWDRDGSCLDFDPGCSELDDDFLGATFANSVGAYSFTGIPDVQDVYLMFEYLSSAGDYVKTEADGFGQVISHPVIASASGTITRNFNATCWDDSRNTTQGACDNQTDVNTFFTNDEARANLFASIVQVSLRTSSVSTVNQIGYWPDNPTNSCAAAAGAASGTQFCVQDGADNHVVAHEMGHNIHRDLLNVGPLLTGGACTSGSSWTGNDPEKCVTVEAFAHLVSGVTWWNQNSSGANYRGFTFEGDTTDGNGGSSQRCVSQASSPHTRRGNAARFFWDLYDSTIVGTNENTGDGETQSLADIAGIWEEFPAGTANRQADESGSNGRNIEDFIFYDAPFDFIAERGHNCLDAQAD